MPTALHRAWRRGRDGVGVDPVLTAALVLALVLRGAWCALAARRPEVPGDPFAYLVHAEDLAAGRGYVAFFVGTPSAYYPPGYPLLLAGLLWVARIVHDDVTAFQVAIAVNLVAGVATVALTHAVARAVAGRRAAGVAAVLVAAWPGLVLYGATAHLESVFTAVVALVLWLVVRRPPAEGPPPLPRLVGLGVILGAATLVRPIVAPVVVLMVLAWRPAGWRRALAGAGVVGLTAAATVLPWTIRSSLALDAPVLVSTNNGDNLCIGHSSFSDGGYLDLTTHCWAGYDGVPLEELELERDRRGTERAIEFAVDNPRREVVLLARKAWIVVAHDHEGLLATESYGSEPRVGGGLRGAVRVVADVWWWLALALAAMGAVRMWRGGGPHARFTLGVAAILLAIPLLFFGSSRFHVPAIPVLSIAAAVAIARAADWRREA